MASLLEKIRTAVLANAHKLIDAVIDLDSIAAVKQHIRDLESAMDKMEEAAIEAGGHRRTVTRETQQLQAQITELNQNIDFILTDADQDNDHLALPMEARLAALEEEHQAIAAGVEAANQVAQALNEALSKVQAKHQAMVAQLAKLEAMDRAAKAKEQAARTMEQVSEMDLEGAGASVDNVAAKIQRRADVADERFDRAMTGVSGGFEKDVALAQAEARLAARKARLTSNPSESDEPKASNTITVMVRGEPVEES